MKFYFNNHQVFESLREAAKDYLQQICKYNEELRDNKTYYKDYSDIVDTDVSLEIYHVKDTDKYFFELLRLDERSRYRRYKAKKGKRLI